MPSRILTDCYLPSASLVVCFCMTVFSHFYDRVVFSFVGNMIYPLRRRRQVDNSGDELPSDAAIVETEQITTTGGNTRGETNRQMRQETSPLQTSCQHLGSDVAMDGVEQATATVTNTRGRAPTKDGRGVTINEKLSKKRAKGDQLDIKFPQPFGKVCGKHAKLFKSEVTVVIRNQIPLQIKKWNDIEQCKPGTMARVWRHLKTKFPELSDQDKVFAMKQVEDQYTNRRYTLGATYRKNKPKPKHVSPDDWQWLIRNVWTDEAFVKRSKQNSINRSKQEMGSKVGTKSIAQIAYELRNPETGEWPTATDVWKATYKKSDETWSVPNGEEILVKLQEAAQMHQERISAAPVPLVEHFALVLGRKANHSRGVGVPAVNRVAEERLRLHAEVQAAEQRAAAAQQRADVAEERAQAMEDQVRILGESNTRLHEEQQCQRDELNSQRRTVEGQSAEVERLVKEQLDQHVTSLFARMASSGAVTFSQPQASPPSN